MDNDDDFKSIWINDLKEAINPNMDLGEIVDNPNKITEQIMMALDNTLGKNLV